MQRDEMTDSRSDDARLRDAEAQMRRTLGLDRSPPPRTEPNPQVSKLGDPHTPRRRQFVRDGEVPVTVIHRQQNPDADSTNQLDAARQAIRVQATAREHAERLLTEAQVTIRELQTRLAHERLAKDEAIERAEATKQTVEKALETVRAELAA